MKPVLFIITMFICQLGVCQYTIDTSLPTQYANVYNRLPELVRKERERHFKSGLGLLISIKTDTLNKNDLAGSKTALKNQTAKQESNKKNSKDFSNGEKDSVSEEQPMWISCICRFKGDTLEIINGITVFSGFDVTTRLVKDKANAIYTEYDSENIFKTHLENEKVSVFSIPVTINNLALDRQPKKGIREIYGKLSVTSNAYYSYLNAGSFKNGYLHKRIRLQYYFRCTIPN